MSVKTVNYGEFLEVKSNELTQTTPNKLKLIYSDESWGEMHSDIRLFAMLPGFDIEGALSDDVRRVIYKYMTPLARELQAIVRAQLPHSKKARADWLKNADRIFKEAELPSLMAEEIPNEYDPIDEAFMPWLLIRTMVGTFRVGWRKRVLVLDWSQTGIRSTARQLFESENVTMDTHMIHCWGYEKATSYLKTLKAAFEKQNEPRSSP